MKNHLKRIAAPRNWDIARKKHTFTTHPNPGMHTLATGYSLLSAMRDQIKVGATKKEVRDVLYSKEVLVDGKKRKDHRFNVGLMDVISFPQAKKYYRIVFNKRGKLEPIEIDEKESTLKVVRIKGKVSKGKKTQLNLGDGRNLLIDKDEYKVGDGVVLELPKQTIKEHLPFKKGAAILMTSGKHLGTVGNVESIEGETLIFKTEKDLYETNKKNALVVGKTKPAVTLQ